MTQSRSEDDHWAKSAREWREERQRKQQSNGHDPDEPEHFETIRASSWFGQPVPETIFLDDRNLIPKGSSTILTGVAGVGKTYIALQAAIASASGTEWLSAPIEEGPVIFYSAEENMDIMHERTAQICHAENISLDLLQQLHFIDLTQIIDPSLIQQTRNGGILTTKLYDRLDRTMEYIRPVSVWLDNRGLLTTGNEVDRNFAAASSRALQLLAGKHYCAVTMLAHPSQKGAGDGTGSSGSTGWFAGGRSVLNFTKPDSDEKYDRVLDNNKTNYAEDGTKVGVKWEFGRFVCTDKPERAGSNIGVADKAERVFMKLLRMFEERKIGNQLSPHRKSSASFAPNVFAARKDCEKVTPGQFANAMEALLSKGAIEIAERGPPSKIVHFIRERKLV